MTHRSRKETPFNEGQDKRPQTAVDVKPNVMFLCKFPKTGDIIHVSVGEIRS